MSRYVRQMMMQVGQAVDVAQRIADIRARAPLGMPTRTEVVAPSARALAVLDRARRAGQKEPIVRALLARLLAVGQRDGRMAVVDCDPFPFGPFGPPLPVPSPGSNDGMGQVLPGLNAGPNCTLFNLPFESNTEEDMGKILPGGQIVPVIAPRALGSLVPGARVAVLLAFPAINWSYVRTIDPYVAFGTPDIIGQAENPDAPPLSPGQSPPPPMLGPLATQPIEGWVRLNALRLIEGGAGGSRVGARVFY